MFELYIGVVLYGYPMRVAHALYTCALTQDDRDNFRSYALVLLTFGTMVHIINSITSQRPKFIFGTQSVI